MIRERNIASDVLNVLAAAECEGAALRLTGQLDRKLYTRANEVLEALGGAWNKKSKAHLFDGDAAEIVETAVLTGTYTKDKQDFGFFETPRLVVERLLAKVGISTGMKVLEPSAGRGAIADHVRERGARVLCVELLEKNFEALKAKAHEVLNPMDFLGLGEPEPHQKMDRVTMNPPFAKRADIHHILHATKFLKPGGRLVSVASSSVKFRDDRLGREFREFVSAYSGSIEDLPGGSFRESGTMVNTVLVDLALPA
jgi:predicted RNA methylase